MKATKTVTIEIFDNKEDHQSSFSLNATNMRRYEIIGILELAIAGIKNECINAKNTELKK